MKSFVLGLGICAIVAGLCPEASVAQQRQFDPSTIKAAFFNEHAHKHEFVANDTYKYRVANSDTQKGLFIFYNERWKKHGVHFQYSRGKLVSKTPYEYGLKQGEFLEYHSDGSIKLRVAYKDNKKTGKETRTTKHGQLVTETDYVKGKKHGTVITYHSVKPGKTPPKQFVQAYQNNRRNGLSLQYEKNGKLVSRTMYENGRKKGKTEWLN